MKKKMDWIFFVAGRFGSADTRGRSALTSILSSLGIAFGVVALIVILSVMNGFQMGYIESILEVSSAHIRITGSPEIMDKIRKLPEVRSLSVFSESQSIMQGKFGSQQGVLLRAVEPDITTTDKGFASSAKIVEGSFDLSKPNSVVLGYELARMLSVNVGDTVSLVAVSGGSSTDLFPENASLIVVGLFKTGYYAIDNSFSFVSRKDNPIFSDQTGQVLAGVKLQNLDKDSEFLSRLATKFPDVSAESWRTYNRAFFGALRVEKNMLLFLVVLIFVVVTVNIHNSMRRSVYERREEISVLTALGAPPGKVQFIFIANGLFIGLSGGIIGLLAGLLLAVRINDVFVVAEDIVNGLNSFISALLLTVPGQAFSLFSPEFFYMDKIPVKIQFSETLFIFLFGVLSAALAAWIASRSITRLRPAEVLRYE